MHFVCDNISSVDIFIEYFQPFSFFVTIYCFFSRIINKKFVIAYKQNCKMSKFSIFFFDTLPWHCCHYFVYEIYYIIFKFIKKWNIIYVPFIYIFYKLLCPTLKMYVQKGRGGKPLGLKGLTRANPY